MLKDITLGQYFPGSTVVHRLDPRTKLIAVVLYIAALFTANNWSATALVLLSLVFCVALSHIRPKALFKGLKPLIVIVILTAVLNLFYSDGKVLCSWWIFRITDNGPPRRFDGTAHRSACVRNVSSDVYHLSPAAHRRAGAALEPAQKAAFPGA